MQMIRKIIYYPRRLLAFYRTLRKIPEAKAIADLPCYYPDRPRKKHSKRIIVWLLKYGEVNNFYTLYGLDMEECEDSAAYMDYRHFMEERNVKNHMGDVMSQLVLLRDKYMFYKYMTAAGLPVAEVFAVIKDGKIYDNNLNYVGETFLKDQRDYFIKVANGECANFVKHIDNFDDYLSVKQQIQKGDYIVQRRIVQNFAMDRLNDKAINTLRIITVYNHGETYVLSAQLRIGTDTSGPVDNWAKGGILTKIHMDGRLDDTGYYKPEYGLTTQYHPNSGIKFADFVVPFYTDAITLTCKAHMHFYGIEYIGWDVAVSENGLVFIEGNDNWEISMLQALDGPMREVWKNMIGK